jgi:uncharacterized protein (TIGR00288 family)
MNIFNFSKGNKRDVKNIAVFVDGPNIIRKEFSIDLDELRRIAQKYGRIVTGKVFLNQFASDKLVEAIANQGFEPCIMLAGEKAADVIAISSRDADYLPAVQAVKKLGKEVLVIGAEPGFSKALQKGADYVEVLHKKNHQPMQQHHNQQRPHQAQHMQNSPHQQQFQPRHPQQQAQQQPYQKEDPKNP